MGKKKKVVEEKGYVPTEFFAGMQVTVCGACASGTIGISREDYKKMEAYSKEWLAKQTKGKNEKTTSSVGTTLRSGMRKKTRTTGAVPSARRASRAPALSSR